jgi:hypothetical protein
LHQTTLPPASTTTHSQQQPCLHAILLPSIMPRFRALPNLSQCLRPLPTLPDYHPPPSWQTIPPTHQPHRRSSYLPDHPFSPSPRTQNPQTLRLPASAAAAADGDPPLSASPTNHRRWRRSSDIDYCPKTQNS